MPKLSGTHYFIVIIINFPLQNPQIGHLKDCHYYCYYLLNYCFIDFHISYYYYCLLQKDCYYNFIVNYLKHYYYIILKCLIRQFRYYQMSFIVNYFMQGLLPLNPLNRCQLLLLVNYYCYWFGQVLPLSHPPKGHLIHSSFILKQIVFQEQHRVLLNLPHLLEYDLSFHF